MEKKLVSVLISNYNYGSYLEACIESVLNQSYENLEVIVYDDGSNDNSLEILNKYKGQIKVICNSNYGISPYINQAHAIYEAFNISKGEIICLMDSDDLAYPDKVNKVVEYLTSNDSAVMLQHTFKEIDFTGNLTGKSRPILLDVDIEHHINTTNNIFYLFSSTSGLAFRRTFLDKHLPLKENFSALSPDVKLYLLAAIEGGIITSHEELGCYRVHEENNSKMMREDNIFRQYQIQCYEYFNLERIANGKEKIQPLNELDILTFSPLNQKIDYSSLEQVVYLDEGRKVYIWGAGETGKVIWNQLNKKMVSIESFVDGDVRKKGESFNNTKIQYSRDVDNLDFNEYWIVATYYSRYEVKQYLIDKLKVDPSKIILPFLKDRGDKQ